MKSIWHTSDANSQSWSNLHRHELLNKKLASVRDADPADILRGLTDCALEFLLGQVGLADEATDLADMHVVLVTYFEEALLQEAGGSVRYHAVTFHLSETETAVSGSTFSGLSGQDLHGASSSGVHLVVDHVLESLIESGSQEDHDLHLLASEPIVHDFVSSELVPETVKLSRNGLDSVFRL